jgi:hypothetical protein
METSARTISGIVTRTEYQERNILSTKLIRLLEEVVIISGMAILRRSFIDPCSS